MCKSPLQVVYAFLYLAGYQPTNDKESMTQATAQRAANANEEEPQQPGNRPVLRYRHGGLELTVWPNQTENGIMYNTTISNSYKDEKTGEWKTASSGPRRSQGEGAEGRPPKEAQRSGAHPCR
jgi:hypothetical protein